MKRLTLIKTSTDSNVNHLYEHIFAIELVSFFDDHGLYDYLDYSFDARSYHLGVIYIDILLYSLTAQKLADAIQNLPLPLDTELVDRAQVQIMAELKSELAFDDHEVIKKLHGIQAKPWTVIEGFTYEAAFDKQRNSIIELTQLPDSEFCKLHCTLKLEHSFAKQHKHLLPLFYVLSQVLLNNVSHGLTDSYYYFGYGNRSEYSKSIKEVHSFRIFKGQSNKLTDELAMCNDVLKNMLANGMVKHCAAYLQNLPYSEPLAKPSELHILETTGVLIGRQGWKTIGTAKNSKEVLKHCTLVLQFENSKQQLALGTLL